MHSHPVIVSLMMKERQADLLKSARGTGRADPYRDCRPSAIQAAVDRMVLGLANGLIALGTRLKSGRQLSGNRLGESRGPAGDPKPS